jgi:hypothetical protein
VLWSSLHICYTEKTLKIYWILTENLPSAKEFLIPRKQLLLSWKYNVWYFFSSYSQHTVQYNQTNWKTPSLVSCSSHFFTTTEFRITNILITLVCLFLLSYLLLWQYRLWRFQGRDTKLERFAITPIIKIWSFNLTTVDFQPKTILFLYPYLKNSTNGIAITYRQNHIKQHAWFVYFSLEFFLLENLWKFRIRFSCFH